MQQLNKKNRVQAYFLKLDTYMCKKEENWNFLWTSKNVIELDILALEFSTPKIKPGMAYVEKWHVNLVGVKKPVEPIKNTKFHIQ